MHKIEQNKAILIIENDKDLAHSIKLYLEDSYQVYITKDPARIHRYISRYHVKLILTDIDVSSPELQKRLLNLKSSNPDVKIILMYMFLDEDGAQDQPFFKNADDYILKPFDADILKSKMDKLFELQPANTAHN
jgi:DNA-binding NtrC family response regulator